MPSKTYDQLTINAAITASTDYVAAYPAGGPLYAVTFANFCGSVSSQLGLGTAAARNTGASGANVPLLNGANTWSAQQTFQGLTATAASAAAGAGLNIAPGAAPTSPNNGDAWLTSTAAFVRVGGATQQLMAAGNNLSDLASASTARTNLGVTASGADATYAFRANNLSDLASASTARANLGLGTAATQNTGTSGATLGLLNGALTFSGANTHAGVETFNALVQTAASAAAGAGLNLPQGAPPTTPNNGDLWTTSAGVFARINGGTVGPFGAGGAAATPAVLFFGDGSDGNVTISGATTLTRDMFYNNLTLSAGAALNPNGWRIFVAGTLDLTAAPTGAIQLNGANGGNAASVSSGGAATGFWPVNSLGNISGNDTGLAGKPGATGTGSAGTQVVAGANAFDGGGNGGAGASGAGTNAGGSALSNSANNYKPPSLLPFVAVQANSGNAFSGIGGGLGGSAAPSGGGDGTNRGGASGGGGQGGGVILVAAATLNRGPSTAAGAIQSKGGSAGTGFAPAVGNAGGAGGSGGGGGGYVILVIGAFAGSTATNCVDISAGNGAAGTNASGTGIGGDGGNSGQGGRFISVSLSSNSITSAAGSSQVSGSAHSGSSGGAGGIAIASQMNL